jgi:3-hydroxyisobutyrate dehydrogenase-like beta-hydroxyacid dehydrogenase
MKVSFIGLGRMGHSMAKRLLDQGHTLTVYDQIPALVQALADAGARGAHSVAEAIAGSDVIISMLPSDEALDTLVYIKGGLLKSMAKGMVHMPMGTHGVKQIKKIAQAHEEAGQILVATTVLGRPELAASGQLTLIPAGPKRTVKRLAPVFKALGRQVLDAGEDPIASTVVKVAHNFVLGCAIEAIGEGVALVRKLGGDRKLFLDALVKGLFKCTAYEVYGKIIVEEAYDKVGASALIGLKDANLALEAAELAQMPLPSANVLRDRLLGAIAHGESTLDWAVVAKDQARASGLE